MPNPRSSLSALLLPTVSTAFAAPVASAPAVTPPTGEGIRPESCEIAGAAARCGTLAAVIDEAAAGSVRGVLENVVQFAVATESRISPGMFLSVVCTEDAPFIDPAAD